MGLDVTHIQLTLTPENKDDFFSIEDWQLVCNVALEHYAKYITTIDFFEFEDSIALVENETQYKSLKKTKGFNENHYIKVFIGELNDATLDGINEFIVGQGLENLITSQMKCNHDGITYHRMAFGTPIKVQGMYFIDNIGERNKGMSNQFYDSFKGYFLWGNKEDFELAYACVGGEWYLENWGQEAVDEMKQNFKENFIDKFEFGKSLLCVST